MNLYSIGVWDGDTHLAYWDRLGVSEKGMTALALEAARIEWPEAKKLRIFVNFTYTPESYLRLARSDWQPQYDSWRHGGWYVTNLTYPKGACGCVSRNYADKKWRIVCDPRPFDEAPTFRTRDDAARGERELVLEMARTMLGIKNA